LIFLYYFTYIDGARSNTNQVIRKLHFFIGSAGYVINPFYM